MNIGFKRGDVVNALGEIAVVRDILKSDDTGNVVLFVRFARNIGDSRPYDTLIISPERDMGISQWETVPPDKLNEAIERRLDFIRKEVSELKALTNSDLSSSSQ